MRPFDYSRAGAPQEAAAKAGQGGAFIAGGTNLLDLMKLQVLTPRHLVDVSRLSLTQISEAKGGLLIGALAPNSDLAADKRVIEKYPLLSRALLSGASPQLRNKATTGGNLLQRTRCYYFYDLSSRCNKRNPGSGCDAIGGFNRIHAILGASDHCIATHPSDMAVAMRALDASVRTVKRDGSEQRIALADLYRSPGEAPHLETILQQGELITHVELPAPPPGRQLYRKVRDRASYAFALFSIAAIVAVENGVITSARLAFGGVGPKPWRNLEAESALIDQPPSESAFEACADALLSAARGYGSNDFKIDLARRTLKATLRDLTHN